jgi:cytidine deaminase
VPSVNDLDERDCELLSLAREARQRAYAPYSNYKVGAALRTRSGRVFGGCNVENAVYPLCTCAERTAVVKAVSEGERDIEAIAVVTQNGGPPCGSCRQVLYEFNPHLRVLLSDAEGHVRELSLADLLPDAFGPAHLPERPRV